ncbi:MAG: hypothetical protein AAGI34_15625 [Pseudomonadota bacterium]
MTNIVATPDRRAVLAGVCACAAPAVGSPVSAGPSRNPDAEIIALHAIWLEARTVWFDWLHREREFPPGELREYEHRSRVLGDEYYNALRSLLSAQPATLSGFFIQVDAWCAEYLHDDVADYGHSGIRQLFNGLDNLAVRLGHCPQKRLTNERASDPKRAAVAPSLPDLGGVEALEIMS